MHLANDEGASSGFEWMVAAYFPRERIMLWGAVALTFSIALLLMPLANAQDLEAQSKALKVIADFAADTCGPAVPIEGKSRKLELSGDVKAQLDGVISKVVNAGISGAGKYQQQEYKNVLQEQLAQVLTQGANCRLDVFKLLQEKMIH
jgi:hypothetical protein